MRTTENENKYENINEKKKYIVLGSSAAGVSAVRELRKNDPDCEILLVSKDRFIYSRCILHQYLCGQRSLEKLCFAEPDFETRYRIIWKKGVACTGVYPAGKQISLDNGETETYDKLLIATGSRTYIPPVKNLRQAVNVAGFRNIEDIEKIKAAVTGNQPEQQILLLGSGLVGMDCAAALSEMGVSLTLVETAGWLLGRQLDQRAAQTYQDILTRKGVTQYYHTGLSEVILDENNRITKAVLTDGRRLDCDYCIVTAGVRANTGFLEGSGLATSQYGLIYDENGQTSDSSIYGAGDVSGMRPIWPVAVKEGIVAAGNMTGVRRKMSDFFASKSTMNFFGIPGMSLGDVNGDQTEGCTVEIRDTKDSYKKIVHKNGKITGAVLQGDLAYSGILQQLIAREIDITKVKKPVFDIDYSDFFHIDGNFEYFYENSIV